MMPESLGSRKSAFEAPELRYLILERIVPLRRLRGVGVTGGPLALFHTRDIDIVPWREHLRILAVRDLVKIEREFLAFNPGVVVRLAIAL